MVFLRGVMLHSEHDEAGNCRRLRHILPTVLLGKSIMRARYSGRLAVCPEFAERPFGPESFVAEFEEKLGRSWYPFDQELADSEMRLILERFTPETASAK